MPAANDNGSFIDFHAWWSSTEWHVIRNLAYLFLAIFYLASVFWVFKDARRRIGDPWIVAAATLLGALPPFLGPIVYLFLRPPEYLEDVRERELEIRAMEERLALREFQCPVCRADVQPEYLVCPVCTTRLRQPCVNCGRPLEALWQVCPYCETPTTVELPTRSRT